MIKIAIFNLKDLLIKFTYIVLSVIILFTMLLIFEKYKISTNILDKFICSNIYVEKNNDKNIKEIFSYNLLNKYYSINSIVIDTSNVISNCENENIKLNNISIDNIDEKNYDIKYTIDNISIKNNTNYDVDYNYLLNKKLSINKNTTILIIHTHGSESYLDMDHTDYFRNEDPSKSVINVGNELENILKSSGYDVIHDTNLYDYPTYTGSYNRALESIENYKKENKNINIVIDLHRDAVSSNPNFAPICDINGNIVSKLMLIVGTDGGGMEHENWRENLSFALKLYSAGEQMYPGIFRQLCLTNSRYNQHATVGSILIEVGATGNTMEQSVNSARYFAKILDVVLNEK